MDLCGISSIVMLLWRQWISFKHLLQRAQQHGGYTKPMDIVKLYKKECLPVTTRNKKYSSSQVVSMTYTLEKGFFAAATFKGL